MNPLWAMVGLQGLGMLGGLGGQKVGDMTNSQKAMLEYQADITQMMRDTMARRMAQEEQFMPYLLNSVFNLGAQKMMPRRTSLSGKGVYEPKRGTPVGIMSDLSFMEKELDYNPAGTWRENTQESEIAAAEAATGENVAGPVITNEKNPQDQKRYNVLGQVIYDPEDEKAGKPVAGGGGSGETMQPPSGIPEGTTDPIKRLWYMPAIQ